MIHSTALVSGPLDTSIQVGAYSIIDDGSQIGKHTIIHNHVRVTSFTEIGQGVVIHQGAALGGDPQDLKFGGEYSTVEIGDETVIREYVTINRGTGANGKTKIGSHSLIMAYAHVAHDCTIGDHVIISNAVNMAGHVHIEDYAGIGGMVPIHQFCRIGRYAFVGGGFRVNQDVPPYVLAAGEPLRFSGLNYVGLRRNGFSEERIKVIDKAYFILYRQGLTRRDALKKIHDEFDTNPDVLNIIQFVETCERGLIKP